MNYIPLKQCFGCDCKIDGNLGSHLLPVERSHKTKTFCADCDAAGVAQMNERIALVPTHRPAPALKGDGFARGRNMYLRIGELYAVLPREGEPFEGELAGFERAGESVSSKVVSVTFKDGRTLPVADLADLEHINYFKPYAYGQDGHALSRQVAFSNIAKTIAANGGSNVAINLATGRPVSEVEMVQIEATTGDCTVCGREDGVQKFTRGGGFRLTCKSCVHAHWSGVYDRAQMLKGDTYTAEQAEAPTIKVGYSWYAPIQVGGWYTFTQGMIGREALVDQLTEFTDAGVRFAGDEARHDAQYAKYPRLKPDTVRPHALKGFGEIHGPFDTKEAAEAARDLCIERSEWKLPRELQESA